MGRTLAEKVWADHVVTAGEGGSPDLIYIDLQLLHEVTSPQAFEGLRLAGREVRVCEVPAVVGAHVGPGLVGVTIAPH